MRFTAGLFVFTVEGGMSIVDGQSRRAAGGRLARCLCLGLLLGPWGGVLPPLSLSVWKGHRKLEWVRPVIVFLAECRETKS